jgi:predicted GH43/DUF377 family glycosyl hydrolase
LSVATSSELRTWTKHGAAFKGTPYERRWSKSGSIVTEIREGRLIAARIDGRFWMYWGEGVCFAATSEDLVTWQLVEFDAGADRFLTFDADRASWRVHRVKGSRVLRPVAVARAQRFDSLLVEPGPPAVLTEDGIVLVYNGAALATDSNGALTGVSYRVGAMLLDTHEPASVLARTTQSVMEAPRAALDGQVPNVCFAQGLVAWRGEWILYLGLGDSRIGMARSAMNMSGVG